MDEIIVAGEPCFIIRSPLIPRTLQCNSLLHPLLSRLKGPEEFVAFVSEPCIAPQDLEVVLVSAFWPRCVFNQVSKDINRRMVQTLKPQNLMLVERELYIKLNKKSCLFGDFIDSLLLYNEDKRKIGELLGKIRSWIKDNKSYGILFLTDVRGMEGFIDQTAAIFEIVVRAEIETEQDEPFLRFTIMKHPNIDLIDKKIEVAFENGQPKRRSG
jgi:hypothetical protein